MAYTSSALSTDDIKKKLAYIDLSKEWRKEKEKKWKRHLEYLQNKFFDTTDDPEDQIAVNLVFPMIKVIIPSIYSRNPDVLVNPRKGPEYQANADTMYKFIKYIVKEIDLKEEVKLVLLDALVFGHGWIKEGFQTDFEEYEDDSEENTSILDVVKNTVKEALGTDTTDYEKMYAVKQNDRVINEMPWALRVSPFNMFVPAYSMNPRVLPWIAEQIIMPLEDAKNNPMFENTKNLKPSSGVRELLKNFLPNPPALADEDCEYVILYDCWDGRTGKNYTLAKDHDKALQYKDNEYSFLKTRYPYRMLRFNEVPDEFYPMSDVEPWEAQQLELNKIRTQMSIHRKRYNRKYVAKKDAFDDDDLESLKNGEDGTIVMTEEDNVDAAIKPLQDAPIHQEVILTESRVKDDITEISGITGYQRGTADEGAKTATEASIVESQSRNRVEERLDVVNTFVLNVVSDIAKISQKFMTLEDVIPILGEDGAMGWLELSPEDIQGEFTYDIVYGSSLPVNKDVDKQQFLQLYEMSSQDPYFNPVALRTELLRKFDQRDVRRFLSPMAIAQLEQGGEGTPAAPIQPGVPGPSGAPENLPPPPVPIAPMPTSAQGAVTSPAAIRASISRSIAARQPGALGGAGV